MDVFDLLTYLFDLLFLYFCRPTWQVGRQLAIIGDDINERYAPQFGHMIKKLSVTPDTAYEAFAGVARKWVISCMNDIVISNLM